MNMTQRELRGLHRSFTKVFPDGRSLFTLIYYYDAFAAGANAVMNIVTNIASRALELLWEFGKLVRRAVLHSDILL
jgi:hypothetical protein